MNRLPFLLLVVLLMAGLAACQSSGPDQAAREWLEAVAAGNTVTAVGLTCEEQRQGVINYGLLLGGINFLTGGMAEGAEADISEVELSVLANDSRTAKVKVTGDIISGMMGAAIVQPVDAVLEMRYEEDEWRVCGDDSAPATVAPGESTVQTESNAGVETGAVPEASQRAVPASTLTEQWTIQTGNIDDLVIAQDGTLYGMIVGEEPVRQVTISPQGETINVVELPVGELEYGFPHRGEFTGFADGTIAYGSSSPVFISPDGEISVFDFPEYGSYTNKTMFSKYGDHRAGIEVVTDETVPLVDDESVGSYYAFRLDHVNGPQLIKRLPLPNYSDYDELNVLGYGFFDDKANMARFLAYEDTAGEKFVLYNTEGELVYDDLPPEMDMSENYDYYLTPWGDLWLRYDIHDEIGAEKGQAVVRIDSGGNLSATEQYPQDSLDLREIHYLAASDEIFYIGREAYQELDRDFNVLDSFAYPEGFRVAGKVFVGYDGNLYVWNEREDLLTKYSPPD